MPKGDAPNPHKLRGEKQDTRSLSVSAVKLFNVKVHSIRTTCDTPFRVYLSTSLFLFRRVSYIIVTHMSIIFISI